MPKTSVVPEDDELPLGRPKPEALSAPRRIDRQSEDPTPVSAPPALRLDAFKGLDRTNPEMLWPALAALIERRADRFDPARFRFIQALATKASQQRPSVAPIVERKALQALSDYLDAYLPARKRAASLAARVAAETPKAAETIRRLFELGDFNAVERLSTQTAAGEDSKPRVLAALTRDILRRSGRDDLAATASMEDKLRLQEREVIRSAAGGTPGDASTTGSDQGLRASSELNGMHHFRQSLRKHRSEQRVTRAIQEGPKNPGPLNAQALIIRSLSRMRDLSPSYANRFASYMDTLLWLEQAGGVAVPAKSKRGSRRRS